MRCRGLVLLYLPLIAGCALARSAPALPARTLVVRDQLVVHSDFELPRRHRLLDELAGLRVDMGSKLDMPISDEPIHVFLFRDRETYRTYIGGQHPEFPDRRAFFVESDTRLSVYAWWGDRVGEDLRHEVTHGYLHAVTPNLPLWLDEGLAEYFEMQRGRRGVNRPHVELLWQRLHDRQWQPDLSHLEALDDVSEMTQQDYAEAWLWVHFLLETSRERLALLQNYLAQLRRDAVAPPLSQILGTIEPDSAAGLLAHLDTLVGQP